MLTTAISEKILLYVCGFGILQGSLLAGLLYFHRNSNKKINRFLALYVFATPLIMALPFFLKLIGWQNSYFVQPVALLPGPFLYFYLRSFQENITWKKALPHFIPFAAFFILSYLNLGIWGKRFPDAKELPIPLLHDPATILLQYMKPVQQVIYYILARRVITAYRKSEKTLYSQSTIDIHWAAYLVNGYMILVSVFIIMFPLMLLFPEYFNLLLLTNMAFATPYLYLAAYKGFIHLTAWQLEAKKTRHSDVVPQSDTITNVVILKKSKPVKMNLPEEKVDELVNGIIRLMEKEKLYQEPELTLQQLAEKLGAPAYQVSQTINEGMNKNFYDLVNDYRVQEAKRLLNDMESCNYTILSVGFEAGFNSKTTFNTVFKKFTGLTPSAYREKEKQAMMACSPA